MNAIIDYVKKIDNELYEAIYHKRDYDLAQELWERICTKKMLLDIAASVAKDKTNDQDTFFAKSIVECMLRDYQDINEESYQDLINKLYSNVDLARTVLDGEVNGGLSFLLLSLMNDKLELTDEQKAFAINEAMNKVGTVRHSNHVSAFTQALEAQNVTDEIEIDVPNVGSMGEKTFNIYMDSLVYKNSSEQAHGRYPYDIRYYILTNHNFSGEVESLLYDFFADNETYEEVIDRWENDIVNLILTGDATAIIDASKVRFLNDREVYERMSEEQAEVVAKAIVFINRIHKLRPTQQDLDSETAKALTIIQI